MAGAGADRVRANLEAIVIRCREGDRRSDWLPVIDRLATEALEQLPVGRVAVPLDALRALVEQAREDAATLDTEYGAVGEDMGAVATEQMIRALGVEGLEG